jgi:hypothetical protein
LAALAVSKKLIELSGWSWPADGIVKISSLAPCTFLEHETLHDYAAFLKQEGYKQTVTNHAMMKHEDEQAESAGHDETNSVNECDQSSERNPQELSTHENGDNQSNQPLASTDLPVDIHTQTALRAAIIDSDVAAVRRLLLESRADPNAGLGRDGCQGVPPLHIACAQGCVEIVQVRILLSL